MGIGLGGFNSGMTDIYSSLLGGGTGSDASSTLLTDYASIKNGSYGKLMKAYYAKMDAENVSATGDSTKRLTLMKSNADSLKKSADVLNNASLWEKKKIKTTDEETGEEVEVEDYDWNAITKAVKSFIEDYNSVVEQAGDSDTKNVLRNAAWMTGMTDKAQNLLSQVGITIGKGNKLELDEDALKKANIATLKSLFTGYGSFADRIAQKAGSISSAATNAAARDKGGTYTRNGSYSDTLSKVLSGIVDAKVGDDYSSSVTTSKSASGKQDQEA